MNARVLLADDYYAGPYFRDVTGVVIGEYEAENTLFEVPAGQLARWVDVEAAYGNMQGEIAGLIRCRGEDKNFARPSGPVELYTKMWEWKFRLPSPGVPW